MEFVVNHSKKKKKKYKLDYGFTLFLTHLYVEGEHFVLELKNWILLSLLKSQQIIISTIIRLCETL